MLIVRKNCKPVIESGTVEVGLDVVLPVLNSGVVVVVAVPADVFCISAVVVIPTEEALVVLVTAVNESVVSVTLQGTCSNEHAVCPILLYKYEAQ